MHEGQREQCVIEYGALAFEVGQGGGHCGGWDEQVRRGWVVHRGRHMWFIYLQWTIAVGRGPMGNNTRSGYFHF